MKIQCTKLHQGSSAMLLLPRILLLLSPSRPWNGTRMRKMLSLTKKIAVLWARARHVVNWLFLFRYGIHLWDIGHTSMWEGRSTWSYNTDLMMDLAMYTVDFAHHLHMLVRNYALTEKRFIFWHCTSVIHYRYSQKHVGVFGRKEKLLGRGRLSADWIMNHKTKKLCHARNSLRVACSKGKL